jgi:hypothetical protein
MVSTSRPLNSGNWCQLVFDKSGRLTQIAMNQSSVSGTIPSETGQFAKLREMYVHPGRRILFQG